MLLPVSDESIVVERSAVVEAGPVRAGIVRQPADIAAPAVVAHGAGAGVIAVEVLGDVLDHLGGAAVAGLAAQAEEAAPATAAATATSGSSGGI